MRRGGGEGQAGGTVPTIDDAALQRIMSKLASGTLAVQAPPWSPANRERISSCVCASVICVGRVARIMERGH